MDKAFVDNTIEDTVRDTALKKKIPTGPNFIALLAYVSFVIWLINNHNWLGLTSAAGYTSLLLSTAFQQPSVGVIGYILLVFGLPLDEWWEAFGIVGYVVAATWNPEVGRTPAAIFHSLSSMTTTQPFMVLFRSLLVIYLSVL
jgi:hypothetical protein